MCSRRYWFSSSSVGCDRSRPGYARAPDVGRRGRTGRGWRSALRRQRRRDPRSSDRCSRESPDRGGATCIVEVDVRPLIEKSILGFCMGAHLVDEVSQTRQPHDARDQSATEARHSRADMTVLLDQDPGVAFPHDQQGRNQQLFFRIEVSDEAVLERLSIP